MESGLKVHTISLLTTNDNIIADDTVNNTIQTHKSNSNAKNDDPEEEGEEEENEIMPEMKRARSGTINTKVVSFFDEPFSSSSSAAVNNTSVAVPPLTEHQKRLVNLAKLVAQFLLSDIANKDDNAKMEEGEKVTTSTNTEKKTTSCCPLDYFQQPGGVMYLVMSLVETRGIDRIRSGTSLCCCFFFGMLP